MDRERESEGSLRAKEAQTQAADVRQHQYLCDRERDLDALWFLSRDRDLSLLRSLESDLENPQRPVNQPRLHLLLGSWTERPGPRTCCGCGSGSSCVVTCAGRRRSHGGALTAVLLSSTITVLR